MPLLVTIPPFISKTKQWESFLSLDHKLDQKASTYVQLTDLQNFVISTSENIVSTNQSFKLISKLNIFRSWAPYWSHLVNTHLFDKIDQTIWKKLNQDFRKSDFNVIFGCVSLDEFYILVYNNTATLFNIYSFNNHGERVDDLSSLIIKQITKVNIMSMVFAKNNQQWLIINSIFFNVCALNLKTHQIINFHEYSHSFLTVFISFQPEPTILIVSSYNNNIVQVMTQTENKVLRFQGSNCVQFGFDESTNAIMFADLLSKSQKRVKLFALSKILENKSTINVN